MDEKITCNNLICYTEKLQFEIRIKELEADLKFNSSILAKQTDLAREAETRVMELEEGIKKHKEKYYLPKPISHRDKCDEELYKFLED